MEGQAQRKWNHEIYHITEIGFEYMCDLCDTKTPVEDIRRTEEPVYLCPDCYQSLSAMPAGKIKDSVMRFLARNVI